MEHESLEEAARHDPMARIVLAQVRAGMVTRERGLEMGFLKMIEVADSLRAQLVRALTSAALSRGDQVRSVWGVAGEVLDAQAGVMHYGGQDLPAALVNWEHGQPTLMAVALLERKREAARAAEERG